MDPKKYRKEKRIFRKQTANYLKVLADNKEPWQLIAAVQNIRDYALTANNKEWARENIWGWWLDIRPAVYR